MTATGLASGLEKDALAALVVFFVCFALGTIVSSFAHAKYREVPGSQPVAFDHRVHVEEEGLDCSACHAFYAEETFSGLPPTTTCALCHVEEQGGSAEEEKVVLAVREGSSLEWGRLFRQPPHVFFSHRRHVVVAEIECARCHGDIGTSERPPSDPHRLTMEECIACHEEEGVARHCAGCHR